MIKLFADGADMEGIIAAAHNPSVTGFTTNPTLMRRAGVTNYLEFARHLTEIVNPLPLSLEVFADEDEIIFEQALTLSRLYNNLFVKLPVSTTKGNSLSLLAKRLNAEGVKLNITAIMTNNQVLDFARQLDKSIPTVVQSFQ